MNKEELEELVLELEEYRHKGATIWLSGHISTPWHVAEAIQVNEEGCYMRDYITDGKGNLKELHFDKVHDSNRCKR